MGTSLRHICLIVLEIGSARDDTGLTGSDMTGAHSIIIHIQQVFINVKYVVVIIHTKTSFLRAVAVS